MPRTLPAILCAAVLGGCDNDPTPRDVPVTAPPSEAPKDVASKDVAPKDVAPKDVAPVAVPKVWQATLTTQFFGTALGPRQVVTVNADGAVKVEVDGVKVGEATLAAAEVEPLARLLAAPELATMKSREADAGPHAQLVVTGEVQLDVQGQGEALTPVLVEVDRLRDMVAPPENFKVTVSDGDAEVLVASNGYVEVKRGGTQVATHFVPVALLGKLRAQLGMSALRDPKAWAADDGGATLEVAGDVAVRGKVDPRIKSVGTAMLAEVRRIGAAVEAKARPPATFEAVFTAQLRGGGPGPLRTITVRSSDRRITLADQAPGVQPADHVLSDEAFRDVSTLLIDPALRLAEGEGPRGSGMVYTVKSTGDAPLEATFHGEPPPVLTNLLNRLEWHARHY